MPPEGSTRAGILPGITRLLASDELQRDLVHMVKPCNPGARWFKWSERESTDRKVRGSNPTSAS
ncbi:hypothetical protein CSKR_111585 [Clonorchis sinensis]|uniref:Uncharacterized protein n=1 Tax=Clonorchis sinensis TaxID=79923 RepID=A0A3R7FM55_CLOSI|nr:hypothetical protein CSKR_111585 [Clonorchis sinensis]